MRHPPLNALILMVLYVCSTGAGAQQVYKCGGSYSQTPCPEGVVIDATDARTKAQKTQTDLATERAERIAAAMEKVRLQQEKANRATPTPKVKAKTAASANNSRASQAKKKRKKESEYFTAQTPGQKKKASKKTATKLDANQS